jgi:hypothetical protein
MEACTLRMTGMTYWDKGDGNPYRMLIKIAFGPNIHFMKLTQRKVREAPLTNDTFLSTVQISTFSWP